MDIKEVVLATFTFISSNFFRGAFVEKGKQLVEKKPDKKEELITRKDIINAINYICFVLCMLSFGITGFILFSKDSVQKRPVISGAASMLMISISIVAPNRITDKQEDNS
jgi:cytochrome b subunit of formate dehydrogenase